MEAASQIIFLAGFLLILSILAGMLSSRIGAPLLLVFLGLGMLAGENGPGGIRFNDYGAAYLIGSLALAVILFDGGLRTPLRALRIAWAPAGLLATLGVVLTAAITGLVAALVLGTGLIEGFLVGALVGSTDAAAVFLLLHQRGTMLRPRLNATLEVESGINDPMAVFLTVTCVELIQIGPAEGSWYVLREFLLQLGVGAAMGLAGGWLLARLINRLDLAAGLYPVFAIAAALVIFGGTQLLEGSGFLAVYLAGIIAGNQRLRAHQLIRRFQDGMAWLSQIIMFLMLGLLVTPRNLLPDMVAGALIAAALIFLARPAAVFLSLLPFSFQRREKIFVAWVGLRGAVPIFLAIIPLLSGLPEAARYFNIVFVVVLASLLLQGWTASWLARRLGLEVLPLPEDTGRADADALQASDRDLVAYRVRATSPVAQRPYGQLPMPPRSQIVTVLREGAVVPLFRLDRFLPGDQVLLLCPPEHILALDRLFLPRVRLSGLDEERLLGDFSFSGTTPLGALADAYGLPVAEADREMPVGEYLRHRLGGTPTVGDRAALGTVELIARDVQGHEIIQVGILLEPEPARVLPDWIERWLKRLRGWRRRTEEAQMAVPEGAEGDASETADAPRQAVG